MSVASVKTAVLAELVKPRPCNKCGQPVHIAPMALTYRKTVGKFKYGVYDVIATDAHPGMAIPQYDKFHYVNCVVYKLEEKRDSIESASEGAVVVCAKISNGNETKVLKVRSISADKAGKLLKAAIVGKYAGFEIVGWSVDTAA